MVKAGLPSLLAGLFVLAGCSLAPEYKVPPTPIAAQYKTVGPWTSAQPSDQLRRDGWWKIYGDAPLDDLEQRLLANNTDLRAPYAHYWQAQAFVLKVQSGLFSKVTPTAVPQRDQQTSPLQLRNRMA